MAFLLKLLTKFPSSESPPDWHQEVSDCTGSSRDTTTAGCITIKVQTVKHWSHTDTPHSCLLNEASVSPFTCNCYIPYRLLLLFIHYSMLWTKRKGQRPLKRLIYRIYWHVHRHFSTYICSVLLPSPPPVHILSTIMQMENKIQYISLCLRKFMILNVQGSDLLSAPISVPLFRPFVTCANEPW
jgi:hypothetical protein